MFTHAFIPAFLHIVKSVGSGLRLQVDDLDAFAADVAALYPAGTPQFLGGQSMGGLIALHSALRNQCRWRGIVLTSAAVNVEWTPVLKCAITPSSAISALHPDVGFWTLWTCNFK